MTPGGVNGCGTAMATIRSAPTAERQLNGWADTLFRSGGVSGLSSSSKKPGTARRRLGLWLSGYLRRAGASPGRHPLPRKSGSVATPSRLLFGDAMEALGIEPGDISPLTLDGQHAGTSKSSVHRHRRLFVSAAL